MKVSKLNYVYPFPHHWNANRKKHDLMICPCSVSMKRRFLPSVQWAAFNCSWTSAQDCIRFGACTISIVSHSMWFIHPHTLSWGMRVQHRAQLALSESILQFYWRSVYSSYFLMNVVGLDEYAALNALYNEKSENAFVLCVTDARVQKIYFNDSFRSVKIPTNGKHIHTHDQGKNIVHIR